MLLVLQRWFLLMGRLFSVKQKQNGTNWAQKEIFGQKEYRATPWTRDITPHFNLIPFGGTARQGGQASSSSSSSEYVFCILNYIILSPTLALLLDGWRRTQHNKSKDDETRQNRISGVVGLQDEGGLCIDIVGVSISSWGFRAVAATATTEQIICDKTTTEILIWKKASLRNVKFSGFTV